MRDMKNLSSQKKRKIRSDIEEKDYQNQVQLILDLEMFLLFNLQRSMSFFEIMLKFLNE